MSFNEKRKFNRVNYSYDILLSIPHDKFGEEFTIISAKSVNLSAGGILFKYPESLKKNMEISLTFFPPHTQTLIAVEGRVVRVTKEEDHYLIAVEFSRFIEGTPQQLNSLLGT